MSPRGPARRKGILHPHISICASDRKWKRQAVKNDAASKPTAVEAGTNAVYIPRFFAGAYSARNVPAPAYSPEAEKPWIIRRTSRQIAAAIPIVLWPGKNAMINVEPDMMRIDHERADRRPYLSPQIPQIRPPMGRRMKDIAKIAKAEIS